MTTEDNKAIVRRFIDEIFVQGSTGAVDELLADAFTAHTWGAMEPGRDGLKAAIARASAGLSNPVIRIDDMVAEDDRVAVRLTSSATHTGQFMGMPATGRRYEIGEIHLFRLEGGRVTEHWHQADFLGMMRQLGVTPGSGGAGEAPATPKR